VPAEVQGSERVRTAELISARELGFPTRLLAAADVYHAMTEPRPHRRPLPPERAAQTLAEEASAGRLDPTR
jgi:HD-GYP domain-containing protein (c-di-GMP phosphodiesterase class II)